MRLLRRFMPGTEPIDVLAIFGYFRRIRSSPVGEKNQEIAASKASGCRRWYGGTRRSCAPTTSKKPSSCSGITSSPSGPAATWRNGCAQPCVPGWNRSRDSWACCAGISMEILGWTNHRVSNGAVEGMNNKIKSISHRSFGFRTAENFIAAIDHCCARLPLPVER